MRNALILAALVSAAPFLATRAQAQTVAWAWYNGNATPAPAYSYNPSGGAISVYRSEPGYYFVTFSGLSGSATQLGMGIATAYGSTATCEGGSVSTSGPNLVEVVNCWSPTGGQVDSDFSLVLEQRDSWSGAGEDAYVYAVQPDYAIGAPYVPAPAFQFNSAGGVNTVTRTAVGTYTVVLPGLKHLGGTVQVDAGNTEDTANGATSNRCQVTSWGVQSPNTVAYVACFGPNGQPIDSIFGLFYADAALPSQNVPGALTGAYVWANNPTALKAYTPNRFYQYNTYTSGALTAQRYLGHVGQYQVNLPAGASPSSTIAVATAYDLPGGYCNVASWSNTAVYVDCYSAAGKPVNAKFTMLYLAAP
jgi:hypothetical protein